MDTSRLFQVIIHLVVLFTAFPVHECAHALAAEKMGDDTARREGRISLNPFKHLDVFGALLMIFAGFGWAKPVPVNARNFKNPKNGMALTALAGPVSNLIMAFAAMIVFRTVYDIDIVFGTQHDLLRNIFYLICSLNISLAVFNLLPIPPLDGSRIFNLFMSDETYFKVMQYEKYVFFALMTALYLNLLDKPLAWLSSASMDIMWFLTGWIDKIFILFIK